MSSPENKEQLNSTYILVKGTNEEYKFKTYDDNKDNKIAP